MFEVGFTEIILIMGLALLVLGPEKLPGLAQKVGRWTGRARSMARQLRAQLEQEVTLEEMTKSRPMQAPPPPPTSDNAVTAAAMPLVDPTAETAANSHPGFDPDPTAFVGQPAAAPVTPTAGVEDTKPKPQQ
jgi:Tat protein translocase TatB subunit